MRLAHHVQIFNSSTKLFKGNSYGPPMYDRTKVTR